MYCVIVNEKPRTDKNSNSSRCARNRGKNRAKKKRSPAMRVVFASGYCTDAWKRKSFLSTCKLPLMENVLIAWTPSYIKHDRDNILKSTIASCAFNIKITSDFLFVMFYSHYTNQRLWYFFVSKVFYCRWGLCLK